MRLRSDGNILTIRPKLFAGEGDLPKRSMPFATEMLNCWEHQKGVIAQLRASGLAVKDPRLPPCACEAEPPKAEQSNLQLASRDLFEELVSRACASKCAS